MSTTETTAIQTGDVVRYREPGTKRAKTIAVSHVVVIPGYLALLGTRAKRSAGSWVTYGNETSMAVPFHAAAEAIVR